MKKHYLAIGAITATTLLAGCDLGDMIGLNNSNEKSEHTTSQSNQSSNKNTSDNHKNNTQQDSNKGSNDSNQRENKTNSSVDNLAQAEKVALALNDPSVSDYVINANELKNHSYFANYNGGGEQKSIDTYQLEALDNGVEGAPSNMKFYAAQPAKGSFSTLIGVGGDRVTIIATQSPGTYSQFVNSQTGHELDLHALLEKYGENSNYKEIANQIVFTNGKTYSDSNNTTSASSSSTEKVTRANVIDKVEDYEGHQLDTDTYTYKEPEQDENGDWGFSILDKNGDLVGSYIVTSDGIVTKYDEHGDPID
ncbi:hypothetical protein BUZ46_03830 [Staphylococcus hominis]|uniref:hypothetical protein n=1 Tax=Staphylococcus hominis TaxID=1290 RepID=UPI000D1E8B49|nr:hypothetical protein [Staphylococcus hominis]MCE4949995.1 hypothetical protein [Staphylococcus hominis]MCE4952424.1 hypothetical protein [Staphylococcus hominis]MCE4974771.1 hypothetical protein [Staphylococcus hominis]PTK23218.1 hypothetical protein BUZ52_00880 [Staphylococcus hominis]PTK26598.1 hypothetical protein BUZ54_02415 [Staphylococcus hominis]